MAKFTNCLAQVSFAYTPERIVFQKMSISADLESRIALVYIFQHELVEMFNCFNVWNAVILV